MDLNRLQKLLQSPEAQEFIRQNLQTDVPSLLLKYSQDEDRKLLLKQIAARQRIRKKLPEWYSRPNLILPTGVSLEQCSSELTARLKSQFFAGKKFADLTGGLGVDCYYFSQNFDETTYAETDGELLETTHYNFDKLPTRAHFLNVPAREALEKLPPQDFIYLDPSRRAGQHKVLFDLQNYTPDVTRLQDQLLAKAPQVLIKTGPMLDIQKTLRQLKQVTEVWVISVRNECKEVLYLLTGNSTKPAFKTWNLSNSGEGQYFQNSAAEKPRISLAEPATYLYEANASLMKTSLMDKAAAHFGLAKLHPHSHLYTSRKLVADFPGRIFKIEEVLKPYAKKLRKMKGNVIARNFPENARQIEQKLQLKPSRESYLLATTQQDERKIFIRANLL